jgi:hypothetical protein
MKVGDRVRVIESVVVYHHPEHKLSPFDVNGLEGEVKAFVTEWRGRPVSANLPILVEFSKKFKAHFRDFELEILEKAAE